MGDPVGWLLKHEPSEGGGDGNWTCEREPEVMGDYNYTTFSGRHRERALNASFVEVQAVRQGGTTGRKLFFATTEIIEVPLDEHGHADADHVTEVRSLIEVVLHKGEECQVR